MQVCTKKDGHSKSLTWFLGFSESSKSWKRHVGEVPSSLGWLSLAQDTLHLSLSPYLLQSRSELQGLNGGSGVHRELCLHLKGSKAIAQLCLACGPVPRSLNSFPRECLPVRLFVCLFGDRLSVYKALTGVEPCVE